jgi:hypothetical protein
MLEWRDEARELQVPERRAMPAERRAAAPERRGEQKPAPRTAEPCLDR